MSFQVTHTVCSDAEAWSQPSTNKAELVLTRSPTSVRNAVYLAMGTLWALRERKMEAP